MSRDVPQAHRREGLARHVPSELLGRVELEFLVPPLQHASNQKP